MDLRVTQVSPRDSKSWTNWEETQADQARWATLGWIRAESLEVMLAASFKEVDQAGQMLARESVGSTEESHSSEDLAWEFQQAAPVSRKLTSSRRLISWRSKGRRRNSKSMLTSSNTPSLGCCLPTSRSTQTARTPDPICSQALCGKTCNN
jgi:hypothetical protein